MKRSLLLLLAAAALAGCGGSGSEAEEPPATTAPAVAEPFAYDADAPLGLVDRGRANADYPLAVRDISFRAGAYVVQGYLVLPPGRARLPAAVYVHGSGGTREQLLAQATWVAARGAVALAITAPSTEAPFDTTLSDLETLRVERDVAVADVVAVRRALDVLAAHPRVDAKRLGLVGWSAGARTGAIAAGVDPRLHAVVLMSGGAAPVAAYTEGLPVELKAEATRLLSDVDPLAYIGRAKGALLLQDGGGDEVVPRAALEALAAAAPPQAEIQWYERAPHELTVASYRRQLDWLEEHLGVQGPPVAGAATGP